MLEAVLYVFYNKKEEKNIVIQSSEDSVLIVNTDTDQVSYFDCTSDLFEHICENVDFEDREIYVNREFKASHIEAVKSCLDVLERETIFHLLNDVVYE